MIALASAQKSQQLLTAVELRQLWVLSIPNINVGHKFLGLGFRRTNNSHTKFFLNDLSIEPLPGLQILNLILIGHEVSNFVNMYIPNTIYYSKNESSSPNTWHYNQENNSKDMKEEPPKAQPYIGYIKDPDYYFDSYSHFSIHEEMLKDSIRTKAYKNAIMQNQALFKDKIVLDVGSGTGILSIFAAKAGAKHVYGIEKANIYIHSRNIIKQNNLQDKITIINGLVQQIALPVEKVDIIISQWMGYFLLYESMFDSVLYARDKWLAADGILLPDSASMMIAAIDDGEYYKKKLSFWDDVYGVSMKCIKKWVLSEPLVDPIDSKDILSNTCKYYDIDLKTVTKQGLDYTRNFELTLDYEGKVYGFVTWFDCQFSKGDKKITLSTSPYKKSTHWKQTIFYLEKPFQVSKGDELKGRIKVTKAEDNIRELNVILSYRHWDNPEVDQYYRIS